MSAAAAGVDCPLRGSHGWFTRRVFNRAVAFTRLGGRLGLPGPVRRRSGLRDPGNLGRWSPLPRRPRGPTRGSATCASGDARLGPGGGLPDRELLDHRAKVAILRPYLQRWKAEVGASSNRARSPTTIGCHRPTPPCSSSPTRWNRDRRPGPGGRTCAGSRWGVGPPRRDPRRSRGPGGSRRTGRAHHAPAGRSHRHPPSSTLNNQLSPSPISPPHPHTTPTPTPTRHQHQHQARTTTAGVEIGHGSAEGPATLRAWTAYRIRALATCSTPSPPGDPSTAAG